MRAFALTKRRERRRNQAERNIPDHKLQPPAKQIRHAMFKIATCLDIYHDLSLVALGAALCFPALLQSCSRTMRWQRNGSALDVARHGRWPRDITKDQSGQRKSAASLKAASNNLDVALENMANAI